MSVNARVILASSYHLTLSSDPKTEWNLALSKPVRIAVEELLTVALDTATGGHGRSGPTRVILLFRLRKHREETPSYW